jgi:hypothetical protein
MGGEVETWLNPMILGDLKWKILASFETCCKWHWQRKVTKTESGRLFYSFITQAELPQSRKKKHPLVYSDHYWQVLDFTEVQTSDTCFPKYLNSQFHMGKKNNGFHQWLHETVIKLHICIYIRVLNSHHVLDYDEVNHKSHENQSRPVSLLGHLTVFIPKETKPN